MLPPPPSSLSVRGGSASGAVSCCRTAANDANAARNDADDEYGDDAANEYNDSAGAGTRAAAAVVAVTSVSPARVDVSLSDN